MDSTNVNTIVSNVNVDTIVSIIGIIVTVVFGLWGTFKFVLPKKWRKNYLSEHNPSPNFDEEMKYHKFGGIYVQPYIQEKDGAPELLKGYFFNNVFVKEGSVKDKVFCILGDTGMGKTAALVNLYVEYINKYKKSNLPYDIWLFSLCDNEVFDKIRKIENKGKCILLLDAVDENTDAQDEKGYKDFISKLEQSYQDFAFVVTTCRPQFFGDETEEFNTTGTKRNGFYLPCKRLHLLPFNEEQVREYLFNLYYGKDEALKQKAEKIVKQCPQISLRPLVLSFVDELVNDEDKDYGSTLDIYDAIIIKLIQREVEKTVPDGDENTMLKWRNMLSEVAGYMYKNKKLSISREEYESILSEYNLKMPQDPVNKTVFRRRSLLTRTTVGYHFSHKSFYEYFMAYRFFASPDEINGVVGMDFAMQIYDELFDAYNLGNGNEHYGIQSVKKSDVCGGLHKLGVELYHINSFRMAESKMIRLLEFYRNRAESSPEAYLPDVAMTLNNLGNLHSDTGKHGDAEKEYKEALEKYRQLAEASPEAYLPDVAGTLNNLGNLHQTTGKHGEAEEEFGEALEIWRQLAESSPEAYLPDVAMTLNNLGILHRVTGKHGEAEKEYGEALEKYRQLAESSPEAYLPDVAMTLNNLGNLHSDTGKHGEAEKEYKEALEKYRQLAESSPETYLSNVAQTLNNLGLLHSDTGKHSDAEKEYGEALEIRRQLAEASPEAYLPYVANTLNNLALLHSNTGKHDDAEKEYGEALKKYRQLAETSTEAYLPYVAGTLNNVGALHYATGKHGEAEKEYGEALEKYRQLAEASPEAYLPDVAMTLNNLGNLHKNTGKHGEAEKEYSEALEIRRQLAEASPGAYLPYVAMTLNNLGNLHQTTGKHGNAEKEYGEALEKYRQLAESSPEAYLPYVAGTLFNIALLYMKQGNQHDALEAAQESLEIYQKMERLSPAAFHNYVEKAEQLLEYIKGK
jgi:Tfp pilus assembly protein PilF